MTSRTRAALLGSGLLLSYALLAALLPEPSASEARPGPGPERAFLAAASREAPPSDHSECGPAGEVHDCGLDAKRMLQRFQAATAQQGRRHETILCRGERVVAGEVTVAYATLEPAGLRALAARHGLVVRRDLRDLEQALLGGAPREEALLERLLEALQAEPALRHVELNRLAQVAFSPSDPFWASADQRDPLLEQAWDLSQGTGPLVALLDTGVDATHPDLVGQVLPGLDLVNGGPGTFDDNGHGTAMAGLICARGDNGLGALGVAFGARILPLKVADAGGRASVADVVAGIDAALQGGAQVINLSLGTRLPSAALADALRRARAQGVLVLAAAGNQPEHRAMFPAASPDVLGVTTTNLAGELSLDAALAPEVDLGAPGEERLTTLPGGVYGFVHGSSAATAYASGVAALLWARDPSLGRDAVARLLRASQVEIPALAGSGYAFGRLDPAAALRRLAADPRDLALRDLRLEPRYPLPGQGARVRLGARNWGARRARSTLVLRLRGPLGQLQTLASLELDLAADAAVELLVPFTAPARAGRLEALLLDGSDPAYRADDQVALDLSLAARAAPDLVVTGRRIEQASAAGCELVVALANLGGAPSGEVQLDLERIDPSGDLSAAGQSLARRRLASLSPGETRELRFPWTFPSPTPRGTQRLRFRARCADELAPGDEQAFTDLVLDAEGALRGLYQASTSVDVILDAPWRVDPDRSYLPVQLFVASRGSIDPATRLRVEQVEVRVNDSPGGGALVYADAYQAPPSLLAPGLELVDELGQVRPGADAFADAELTLNGRHDVLRIPRSALGVPFQPSQGAFKFVDTTLAWSQRRLLLLGFQQIRRGQHRSVTRTHFSSAKLPGLPGENHYHDVHHHTIAEWNFGSPLDVFAPRKAYGGPLQMVFETAYAMGVIDSPTAQGAFEKLITTDHNCFNSRTIADPDGPDRRPPFGPQSPSAQPGKTQLEAYRAIFGECAGEEVTFSQQLPGTLSFHPAVDPILRLLPNLPIGAHLLAFRADHVEGPWHGGNSFMPSPNSPQTTVHLAPLLRDWAQTQRLGGPAPFGYAAHPFSGMGWRREHLERSLGLDPQQRTQDELHATSGEFMIKGLEWFNGRGVRRMSASQVDFRDLNPWADPQFARGKSQWDGEFWEGVREWHRFSAETLDYAFVGAPERRFVRKIYHAGGSDAHGDFNFNTARQATPINLQSTYHVGSTAWYDVRTYCFGEGKAGATPGERWLEAFADGNTVVSDGPLLRFHLDANGKFDSESLAWHDDFVQAEDADARIGGEGPLDGGFTALVRRSSLDPVFGYRYTSSPEFGDVDTILIYKTEVGRPNPTRTRTAGTHTYEQPIGVGTLATSGADRDLHQILDPTREGLVDSISAFSLGAFTGGNPDQIDLGPNDYRCLTNAAYAVPYEVRVDLPAQTGAAALTSAIPPGGLVIEWRFDVSMDPGAYAVEVQALSGRGRSLGKAAPALTRLVPLAGSGWSDQPGIQSSVLRLTNTDPLPLSGEAYPSPAEVSFVAYWRDAPRDAAGNQLNPIALSFTAPRDPQAKGSTAAAATASGGGAASGAAGAGGCSLRGTFDPAVAPAARRLEAREGLLTRWGLLSLLALAALLGGARWSGVARAGATCS